MFFHGLVICASSLVTCLFMYFAISNWTIFFCFILRVHYVFKILVLCQICCLQILLLICVCLFIFISECFKKNKWMLHKTKDFNFDEVQLVKFSSIDFTFCVKSMNSLLSPES